MSSFFEAVFEFLFKYRPVVFERGDLVFGAPWPMIIIGVVGVALVVPPLLGYARISGPLSRADRAILATLRLAALAIVLFCLFRPILVLATVVPQENFLGILIDDSRSMQIADDGDRPRSDFIFERFGPEGSELLTGLSERFKLRFFRFSESAERLASVADLTFSGHQTKVGRALDRARSELASVPLAGLVLVTDGADNSETPLTESILQLRARGVPVHTVGLGLERFDRDIEITRVQTPRVVLEGASVAVDVMLVQSGFSGQTVRLNAEDGGRIVSSQEVRLPDEGEVATVRVHFTASEPGPRLFRFRVLPQADELVTQNNVRDALIVVRDRREKILYFEGEPRFEVKYLRRAVAEDENLHVVTLLRTGENKFYRMDVDDEGELASGFPKTREELFQYRGLILGSVEASFFTHDQLQMITEFVSERGGGLLTLGGRHSFAEGGYAGTPIADVLPVVLEPKAPGDTALFYAELKIALTPFGRSHPITQIAATPAESELRWSQLPELLTVNPLFETKPGASTLLTGVGNGTDGFVVLASQRFGRGRSVAFPVHDSWIWQMHADIPLDDMTHEIFWRQLLRWLVSSVPDPVIANVPKGRVGLREAVTITTEVADSAYLQVNDAEVIAYVTTPSGEERSLPMEWTVERDGEYSASFVPDEHGLYEIRVDAQRGGESIGSAASYVQAAEPVDEYFDAEMHASLLKRIAEETGGHFYTPETVGALPEDVRFTESGSTVYEEKDLWDMPVVFFLLIGLVGTEWGYRRVRGLV